MTPSEENTELTEFWVLLYIANPNGEWWPERRQSADIHWKSFKTWREAETRRKEMTKPEEYFVRKVRLPNTSNR